MSISFETTQTITVDCHNNRKAIVDALSDVPDEAWLEESRDGEFRFNDIRPRVQLIFMRRVIK